MPESRVLVVGTTADYVENIRLGHPGQVLFITDSAEREASGFPRPEESEEISAPLEQASLVMELLWRHLRKWNQSIDGITTFDCESLPLAARIAQIWKLPYPDPLAIEVCRNKLRSKEIWQQAKVPCPKAAPLDLPGDAMWLWDWMESPVILKPVRGTGSEFVYRCHGSAECMRAFRLISDNVSKHHNNRLYHSRGMATIESGARVVMEELIEGDEYSCDFVFQDKKAKIIRLARKFHAFGQPVGTIRAYLVPAQFPQGPLFEYMEYILAKAAEALGLENTISMVDFIVRNKRPYLLEMTPRPGGDCLPDLIRLAGGLDMLGLSLAVARGMNIDELPHIAWRPLVGLRLFSDQPGQIVELDASALQSDPRVLQLDLKRGPGDQITLPPEDYDSRILGHLIFKPDSLDTIEQECGELESKIILRLKQ